MQTEVRTTLRNATLTDLVDTLRSQQDLRFDLVASANRLSYERGHLLISGADEPILTESGVIPGDVRLNPTEVFEGGIADKLGVPVRYLRRMRSEAQAESVRCEALGVEPAFNPYLDLLDTNINTWLASDPGRQWLVRGFLTAGSNEGVGRAFLSNSYGMYDNLDFLMAVMAGAKDVGVGLDVLSADLSERRMRVKVACPEVAALAPALLAGYRSPFDNASPERARMLEDHGWLRPDDRPVVFAGFTIGNSETGNGSWFLTPQIIVQACTNGLTIKADMLRGVHLGAKMDEGVIRWSDDTQRKNIELISAQTADAIRSFTTVEYVEAKIAEIEELAGVKIAKPFDTIERVGQACGFSKAEQDMILADFIVGGQTTAGGLMQAVTSAAQRVEDPDRAAEFEDSAMDVLAFAAKVAE